MAEMSEEKIKEICRDLIDREQLVSRPFCILRHQTIETEVEAMQKSNEARDAKLDSIRNLAFTILGGIIITLAVQVISLLGKTQ